MVGGIRLPPARSQLPGWLVIVAISLLTIVVLALSYAALTSVGSGDHDALPARPGPPTSSPNPASTESATRDIDEEATPGQESLEFDPAAPNRLLLAVSESVLVRATVGTCEEPGTFEISGDGGATWAESGGFAESGATQVLRLLVGGGVSSILVVANDDQCEPRLFGTDAQGSVWYQAGSPGMAWYLDPSSPWQIGTPDGVREIACEAVSLAAVGSRAALLCADSSVITSSDRGATWSDPISVPTAVAINVTDSEDYIVALANQGGCRGIRTGTLRDGALTTPGGCLEVDVGMNDTTPGNVAVARVGDHVFVWGGRRLGHSSSGGMDWGA